MYEVKPSGQFKKDMKRVKKSGRKKSDLEEITKIVNKLALPEVLPKKNRDHDLSGNLNDYRECHILPDLLLIYRYFEEDNEMMLYRIGNHSELF